MKSNRLIWMLWLLALVPPLVIAVVELNKTVLIWHIRIVDFADLVVLAPFYLVAFLVIHSMVFEKRAGPGFWLGLGLIGLFMNGHAMHLAANAINTYSTEIHNYRSQIPNDVYALIYFFDEDLGHWILFAGLYGLMGVWLMEDRLVDPRMWRTALPSLLVGGFQAVAVIESSHPWVGFVACIFLAGVLLMRVRTRGESLWTIWREHPVARYVMIAAVAIVVGELIYWILVGGFFQPSQFGY